MDDPLIHLFQPGRLQLFFHTLGFGSVVLSQSRGPSAPPYTKRVPVLDGSVPDPFPIRRMVVSERRDIDEHLTEVSFKPADDKARPQLYLNWGAQITRIDLASILSGKKVVHRSIESFSEILVQKKSNRWPKYHAASIDGRVFMVLTISSDENAWEVKRIDMLFHRRELMAMSGAIENSDNSANVPDLPFLALYRSWGQVTPMRLWGDVTVLSNDELLINHDADDDDEILDDSENLILPPSSGVLAIVLPNGRPVAMTYEGARVLEAFVLARNEPVLQPYAAGEPPKDFGKRLQTLTTIRVDFGAKRFTVATASRHFN